MIGIYVICFMLFPFSVLFQIKRTVEKEIFLEKNDTDVIKGIATCFIILAHLIIPMKDELHGIGVVLNIYAFTGGMGVLLFFFVSGYGIYKGYGQSKLTIKYWIQRLLNVYLPCVLIQSAFGLLIMEKEGYFDVSNFLERAFLGAWFIDVIMIQYFIFYIAKKMSKNSKNLMIAVSFLLSIIVAIIFCIKGFNPRWYNGLLLFSMGMLVAYKEQELLALAQEKWTGYLIASGILFVICGGIFAWGKGIYRGIDICKVLAGMCLCLFICVMSMRIQLCSKVMQYIGKRSLFFYLIHINVLDICGSIEMTKVKTFYIVILLTCIIVEFFYQLYQLFRKRGRKKS